MSLESAFQKCIYKDLKKYYIIMSKVYNFTILKRTVCCLGDTFFQIY